MNLQNLRFKLGMVAVAMALVLGGSGCGSQPKKTLKVDGKSYPECSLAVISDFNQMARAHSAALEGGLSAQDQRARLADLEKELTIFFERHLNEGTCAASVKDSDEAVDLSFPANREELETRVKSILDRVRKKLPSAQN